MASGNIADLTADLEELQRLSDQATRPRLKDMLGLEVRKLQTQIATLTESQSGSAKPESKPAAAAQARCYDVKLTNYAWDQSDKFVKIFVSLKGVQGIPAENISCNFTERMMVLTVKQLDNRNYQLTIRNLLEPVDPSSSSWKVKSDMVVVMLSKTKATKWQWVTKDEQKAKEVKTPKMDPDEDPEKGLMKLMKQMYDEGDDEMKRTMTKAWMESRDKTGASLPGF